MQEIPFKLTILGSNAALPNSKYISTSHILKVNNRNYLIDCGEGTQRRLRQNKISFSSFNHIFISHLHGDHYYGLFGLISTLDLLGRKKTLTIFSDSKLKKQIDTVFENTSFSFKLKFYSLNFEKEELIHENKALIVKSFPLKHRINTCGFVFREKERKLNIKKNIVVQYNLTIPDILKIKDGKDFTDENNNLIINSKLTLPPYQTRSYAFCSDTAYHEPILKSIKNIDLLYHEATFAKEDQHLANKTQHSTSIDAATIAKKANAKKLIIGHFSDRYKDKNIIVRDAQSIFENTYAAKDHAVFSVKLVRKQ